MTHKIRLATALIVLAPTLARAGGGSETAEFPTIGAELARSAAANGPAAPALQRRATANSGGAWSVGYDSDAFGGLSRNVTNGWSVGWLSDDIDAYDDDSWARAFRDLGSNLGWVGDGGVTDRVSFTFGHEMFTPPDITVANPPFNVPPYVGVLFFDAMIHTSDVRETHTWAFRLGLVGPWSQAEEAQELFQDLTGGDDPKGWDHQVHTELIANVNYEYRYRGLEGQWGSMDYDLGPILGWSAGTYSVHGNLGAELRFGRNLPEEYGVSSLRSGLRSRGIAVPTGQKGLSAHGFLTTQAWGVARYLPYDGNTFKDSRSVGSETFLGSVAGGVAVATGGLVFRYTLGWFTDQYDQQSTGESRYGTVSLSWSR